jgi:hypothetical protein
MKMVFRNSGALETRFSTAADETQGVFSEVGCTETQGTQVFKKKKKKKVVDEDGLQKQLMKMVFRNSGALETVLHSR